MANLMPDDVRVHDLDLERPAAPPRRDPLGGPLDLGALLGEKKLGIGCETYRGSAKGCVNLRNHAT